MEDLKRLALEYVERHNTMTIATVGPSGPWAATVFYASKGFTLYFLSNPSVCLHCRNISQDPRVAVAISEDYKIRTFRDIKRIKGVQMEGRAEMLEAEEEIREAIELYANKFPITSFYLRSTFGQPNPSFLETLMRRLIALPKLSPSKENRFYRIRPLRVFLVDNERSFERRQEIPL
jgi:uncharacterized protein YhbP (UPF0306 family)